MKYAIVKAPVSDTYILSRATSKISVQKPIYLIT